MSDTPTERDMVTALIRALSSSEYWVSVNRVPDTDGHIEMILFKNITGDSESCAYCVGDEVGRFVGPSDGVITQLIAYQLQERLT